MPAGGQFWCQKNTEDVMSSGSLGYLLLKIQTRIIFGKLFQTKCYDPLNPDQNL